MNSLIVRAMLSVAVLFIVNGTAAAEVAKGKVKGVAGDLKLFTLKIAPEKVLFLSWDSSTKWNGLNKVAPLKVDEVISVDYRLSGDYAVAASVQRSKTQVPAGIKVMSLDALRESLSTKDRSLSLVLVDTRPTEIYDAGHIPGAISVPLARLVKRTYGLLPEVKGLKLVFYDEGQGGESAGKAAEISARDGYTDTAVFSDGAAGWADSGSFLEASTAFIRKTKPVVIDVRTREEVSQGHIEGAVNYPAAMLKEYFGNFPLERVVPIVVFGDSEKEVLTAAGIIRGWGYRNVTVYPGGAAEWVKDAEVLESGPAGEQILTAAASHGGKLNAEDFKMALISPLMVEILDVRPAGEHKKGGFPNAKHIPLQDLPKRHGELDRGKIQVVFATDVIRAEMAYDFLKSKKYRANYLDGIVEFKQDGKYEFK